MSDIAATGIVLLVGIAFLFALLAILSGATEDEFRRIRAAFERIARKATRR